MTVIGITGPSGAGKSEVSRILNEQYSFPVLNADEIYHSLVSSPSPCLNEIRSEFGEKVIDENGKLNRRALSALVFGEQNKERLDKLNSITHKYVVDVIDNTIAMLEDTEKACVIDAPLLIEAGLCDKCDITVAVLASKNIRVERISHRDGITQDAAYKRINSQKEDSFYISNTDYVIVNDADASILSEKVKAVMLERGVIV